MFTIGAATDAARCTPDTTDHESAHRANRAPDAADRQLRGGQTAKRHLGPGLAGNQPDQRGRKASGLLRASRDHGLNPVRAQPPQAEHQRVQRRGVRPVRVVHPDDNRPAVLKLAQQLQQGGSHREQVEPTLPTPDVRQCDGKRRDTRHQLLDHSQRKTFLGLIAPSPQHPHVPGLFEGCPDQRRLADTRRSLHEHHPRPTRPCLAQSLAQQRHLSRPAHERPSASPVRRVAHLL
jgi:hypothetical protein